MRSNLSVILRKWGSRPCPIPHDPVQREKCPARPLPAIPRSLALLALLLRAGPLRATEYTDQVVGDGDTLTLPMPRGPPPSQRVGPERVGRAIVPVNGITARKALNFH